MAISFIETPDTYRPSANPTRFVFSSDSVDQTGMNYVVDLYVGGDLVSRDKISPHPVTTYGIYDVAPKVAAYVANTRVTASTVNGFTQANSEMIDYQLKIGESIPYWEFNYIVGILSPRFIGTNTHPFSAGDQVTILQYDGYTHHEYNGQFMVGSTTSNSISTDNSAVHTGNLYESGVVRFADNSDMIKADLAESSTYYLFKSAYSRQQDIAGYGTGDFQQPFVGNDFLSNMPDRSWTVRPDSRMWLYSQFTSAMEGCYIFTYNYSTGLVGEYNACLSASAVTSTKMGYCRVGPQDLIDATDYTVTSGPSTIINDQVDYYIVRATNFVLNSSNAYTFKIDRQWYNDECPVQLLFHDQKGSYVPVIMQGRKDTKYKASKDTYKKYDYFHVGYSPYNIASSSDRQYSVFSVEQEVEHNATAYFNNKVDAQYFSELFLSTDVYEIQSDGSLLPVVVHDGSMTVRAEHGNLGKLSYNVKYSYAFDQPLNL